MDLDGLSRQWIDKSKKYVAAINTYVDKGTADGWGAAGKQPDDNRQPLAAAVLNVVREANKNGDIEKLRSMFPPAWNPFIEYIKENGQGLSSVHILPDGRILLRIGASYEEGRVVEIYDLKITERSDILNFGCSPNRRYYAIAEVESIKILDGWDGPAVARFNWPTGLEDLPETTKISPLQSPFLITQLLPFPDGQHILLVSSNGIFLLTEKETVRLLPKLEQLEMAYEEETDEQELDGLKGSIKAEKLLRLDMEHGAISYAGDFLTVGHQDSSHLIYDGNGQLIGDIGNLSEYPHYAIFSSDDEILALNSCHFYNGRTIGFPLKYLPDVEIPAYELDPRCVELNDEARIYAGIYRDGEFIVGDAYGYLRAFDKNGKFKWRHHIGSTIGAIDISEDGQTLAVTSYAGFLCILKLDSGEKDPFTIGTTTHKEQRRWLFWKNEASPLAW